MKKKILSITKKDFDVQTFRAGGKGKIKQIVALGLSTKILGLSGKAGIMQANIKTKKQRSND